MSDYLQDLVQNIYTNCDMSGFNDYNKAVQNLNRNFSQSARERIKLNELETKSRIRINDYEEKYALKKARRDESELFRMRQRNWLWRTGIRLIGAYFSIQTLRNIIRTGAELQLIQKSITGLTGSGQDWEFLDQQAYKFGLSLKTVSQGYKNFYSSASMAGFDRGQIQSMFSDMLLGARSIGASDQQIGGALLALEQMMSKGKVSMEELRRQLGNALPGAFEIGAKAMGVTTQKFNEMVKAGISAQEFVPKFIKTFKEQYQNGWKDVEQTVSVAQGRLLESWEKFTMNFMHGEAGKALAQGINQLAEFMRSPAFYKFVDLLGKIFTLVVKVLTFSIKNIREVLILLGAGGLLAIMPKLVTLFAALKVEILTIFSYGVINGIKYMATALGGVALAVGSVIAEFVALLAILLLVQDIWTSIFHPDYKTLTNRPFRKGVENAQKEYNDKYNDMVLNEGIYDDYLKNKNTTKNVLDFGSLKKLAPFAPQLAQPEILSVPYGRPSGFAAPLDLDKEENNNISVSIGDINVYSNSSNPQEVAQEVQNQLVALFMGQGLMTNVGEMVVG